MNRVAVWILSAISEVILFFGIMTLSMFAAYGASSSCASAGINPPPCTPVLQQVTITNPLGSNSPLGSTLMILLLAVLIGLPAWIGSPILAQRRGSSSRTAILIVSIIASAFVVVSLILPLLTSPALATPQTCLGSGGPGASQICFSGVQAKLVALLGIGLFPVLASLLIGMPAWVMALTETARRKLWGWFVAVLLFSPIAAMLYGFLGAGPNPPAASPAPAVAAPAPGA